MTPRTKQCAEIVCENPGITRGEIAAVMKCAPRTAGCYLHRAMAAGLIRADSRGRYAGWREAVDESRFGEGVQRVSSVWALSA